MAFETLARQGYFAATLDLCLAELGNLMVGSVLSAGADRLTAAGAAGIPQIVAPGCADLIDFAGWQDIPQAYADRPFHAHNRLIKSSGLAPQERRAVIRDIAARLAMAEGPVHFMMPLGGVEEWDRAGDVAHDPDGLNAMIDEVRLSLAAPGQVPVTEVDAHINDPAFANAVLQILDAWIADGTIAGGADAPE